MEHLLAAQAQDILLLFARIGAFCLVMPFFSDEALPGPIRLLLSLAMTIALSGLLRGLLPAMPVSAPAMLILLGSELACGLMFALLVRLFFMALGMAGAIMSIQTGLTSAIAYDPATGGQAPVLSRLASLCGLVFCLSLGVHHVWIAALVDSYRLFPPGALPDAPDMLTLAVETVARALAVAVSLAAPLLAYGLIVNLALGLFARLAPAIQVFFVGQPLVLALGLLLTAATLPPAIAVFAGLHEQWLADLWGGSGG